MELFDIIPFLIVLTVLVYVHEWGHYWVAVKNGVRVEVFSIGFGPEIFGWNNRFGTRWKISAIPLGGYVKMYGQSDTAPDNPDEDLSEEDRAVSFAHKSLSQRAAIVAAGPAANFLFAIVVFFLLAWLVGSPVPHSGIGQVLPKSPASEAGLEPGDTILSIDGEDIELFSDLQRIVQGSPGEPLTLEIMRRQSQLFLTVIPSAVTTVDGSVQGRLGVSPDPEQLHYERAPFPEALWLGFARTLEMITGILDYLADMIAGNRGTEDLGGPLRIAQLSGDMAEGGVINLIVFMAALSVNLGLINLFPIPVLDGGHLVFYAAEFIRGKPLGAKAQEYGFGFGLILLILLFVFVTWNDLEHLRAIEYLKNLLS